MAGTKALEKIEQRPSDSRSEPLEAVEKKAEVFYQPISVVEASSFQKISQPSEGLRSFLKISERQNLVPRLGAKVPAELGAEALPPPITGLRSLWENIRFYLKKAWTQVGELGAGFSLPMMGILFSLFPRNEFSKAIEETEKALTEFDRVQSLLYHGTPLNAAEQKIAQDPKLLALSEKRDALIVEYHNRLLDAYADPKERLGREVKRILAKEPITSPLGILPYLAYFQKFSLNFFAGRFLHKAPAVVLEGWMQEWFRLDPLADRLTFDLEAIEWLRIHKPEASGEILISYLKRDELSVVLKAAAGLAELGQWEKVEGVLEGMLSPPYNRRLNLAAADVISRFGGPHSSERMRDFLIDNEKYFPAQVIAGEYFGRLGIPEAKDVMFRLHHMLHGRLNVEDTQLLYPYYFLGSSNLYLNFFLLARTAKVLKQLGRPKWLDGIDSTFQRLLKSEPEDILSTDLEKIPTLLAEVEGSKAYSQLRSLAKSEKSSPELRSGALRALLAQDTQATRKLCEAILRNPKEPEALRVVALQGLNKPASKKSLSAAILKPFALELANSPLFFVRLQAMDALIAMGEGTTVKPIIRELLREMPVAWFEQAKDMVAQQGPYAQHEYDAVYQFDAWALQALGRIDPAWEGSWFPNTWEERQKILSEEWNLFVNPKED